MDRNRNWIQRHPWIILRSWLWTTYIQGVRPRRQNTVSLVKWCSGNHGVYTTRTIPILEAELQSNLTIADRASRWRWSTGHSQLRWPCECLCWCGKSSTRAHLAEKGWMSAIKVMPRTWKIGWRQYHCIIDHLVWNGYISSTVSSTSCN